MREPPRHVIDQAVVRVARADYPQWVALLHASGCCIQPVRLAGRTQTVNTATGEIEHAYTSAGEPDRVLLKSCGTRRATRCPACAAPYQGDARALIIAGLAGGKGVPASIAEHPTVFATFTAPSFGPVHQATGVCHPRTRCGCAQQTLIGCGRHHPAGDPAIGTPLCPRCYDHAATIIFNACATTLWARTCNTIRRALAAALGLTVSGFARRQRLSFVKVVEYQARGVVHLHALLRADALEGDRLVDTALLADAVRTAGLRAHAPNPLRPERPVTWGAQLDVEIVDAARRRAAAGYLAKYATKSSDANGALDRRLHHADTSRLQLPEHLRQLVTTAWQLGERPDLAHLNLRHWAHTLGYRGHWLTKSRDWSTTFGALRTARHDWQQQQHRPADDTDMRVDIGDWTYTGSGHRSDGDQWLAASAAEARRLNRRTAWEEHSTTQPVPEEA
jgi:hypothetical protein